MCSGVRLNFCCRFTLKFPSYFFVRTVCVLRSFSLPWCFSRSVPIIDSSVTMSGINDDILQSKKSLKWFDTRIKNFNHDVPYQINTLSSFQNNIRKVSFRVLYFELRLNF